MSRFIAGELASAFRQTIGLLRETIERFDDGSWRKGATFFQVPAKVAYHDVECLDYYFTPNAAGHFRWGHRLGKPWWELPNEEQPSQEALIAYLDEVAERIAGHFARLEDQILGQVYDSGDEHRRTGMGHYLYALRHTAHHLGSLASLAASAGVQPGDWEGWV